MARLKGKFIEKEVEQQSQELRKKNTAISDRPIAKNFLDYAKFCIMTNNFGALMKGYWKLSKIYFLVYSRYVLRCHYCRKKQLDKRKILNMNTPKEERRQIRKRGKNNVEPVWWQNSRVSYSFFASGSSSFLDFSLFPERKQAESMNRKKSESSV